MSKEFDVGEYYLPKGLRVYAIGDVHGHLAALDAMHDAISQDMLDNPPDSVQIIYMGDYIDRGPDSKGVIDRLIERRDRGDGIHKSFLVGNHELAAFEFIRNPMSGQWLTYGGIKTMQSYGVELPEKAPLPAEIERASVDFRDAITPEHWAFFKELEVGIGIGDFFFAHAGVNPAKSFETQELTEMTNIREPFLGWKEPLERMVVHGHTISEEPVVTHHRIGVDTGCFAHGILTAGVIEGNRVRFLQVEDPYAA